MFFMFKDSFHVLGLVVTKEMVDRMIAHKVHYSVWGNFLSLIDAYRVVSASFHTPNVTEHVGIVSRLTSELSSLSMHGFWSSGVNPSREEQAKRCSVYSLYQRVEFYRMRAFGPNLRDFNARMQAFRKDAGISDDWNVCEEVKRLLEEAIELEVDVWDKFWANVKKEWVGEPIPVEDVSTPIPTDEPSEDACVVCQNCVTPPGVRTFPCSHTYCAECLESWIHACEPMSHACPQCRTILFPEPKYKLKQSEMPEDYAEQLDALRIQRKRLTILSNSVA